ncbi:hypothetical protein FQZ97_1018640 [compost metagenome]
MRIVGLELWVWLELVVPRHLSDGAKFEIAIGHYNQVTHRHPTDEGSDTGDAVIRRWVSRYHTSLGKTLLDLLAIGAARKINSAPVTKQHITTG